MVDKTWKVDGGALYWNKPFYLGMLWYHGRNFECEAKVGGFVKAQGTKAEEDSCAANKVIPSSIWMVYVETPSRPEQESAQPPRRGQ